MFNIDNFNVISDDENYYVFRSLEAGDIKDIEEGIKELRTDRERYKGQPKYNEESTISLEEMFDHIKMHYRQDTNCISFTTSAAVAILYGRDNETFNNNEFNDKYAVLKIPKQELGTVSHFAPLYLIEEIKKIIDNHYEQADEQTKYYLDYIKNCRDAESIKRIINIEEREEQIFTGDIEFEKTNTTNYSALTEQQNLEKNKLIAMIDVLPFEVVPNVSNKFLIQTIGSAFASMEVTHYNKIQEKEFINCPQYVMDTFALLQQINTAESKEVEQILIKKLYNHELDNLEPYKYYNEALDESNISIDNLYEISEGKVDYETMKNLYTKTYYFAKSKLRSYHSIELLEQIIGNNYPNLLEQLKKTYGIEPQITNKQSVKKIKLTDSVGLSYSTPIEQELLEILEKNYSSKANCEELLNNKEECAQIVMLDLLKEEKIEKELYYANAIIDSFNWKQFGIVKIGEIHRQNIIKKLLESDFLKIYEQLKNKYNTSEISRILLANIIKENKEIDEEASFELEELEEYLGYFQLKGTEIKLKRYQADATRNIKETYKTKNYTNVILPTGTGKSFVAISQMLDYIFEKDAKGNIILEKNKPVLTNKNILYVAPSNEILEQVAEYLVKNVIGFQNISTSDTYLKIVNKYLPNLDLYTYAYLRQNKSIREKQYDFIVMDELHRTGAKETQPVLEELYKNQNEKCKVLGITATPTRDCDGKDMADYWARFFGYTQEEIMAEDHLSYNMDVNQAIILGYLTNPRVINCEYNLLNKDGEIEELLNMLNTLPEGETKEKVKLKYNNLRKLLLDLKPEDGIGTVLRENVQPGENCIVFCPVVNIDEQGNKITGIQVLELYKKKLEEIYGKDKINCFFMLGEYTKQQCIRNLNGFQKTQKDKINFMIVMDKYNEGIHVPCNKMIWFRPIDENSTILTTQQAGRIMKPLKPGERQKEEERPLIIDLPNNLLILSQDKQLKKSIKSDDISRFKLAVEWIKEYNRIPDINSKDKIESNMAGILKTIIFFYKKDIKNIDKIENQERKIKVQKIKKLSEEIPFYIWDLNLPKRTKETKQRIEKPYWEATPIYRDFVKIKTEIADLQNVNLIEEYIEMLADDRISEIVSKAPVTFNINGQEITMREFWHSHNTEITKTLEEEKYKDQKYNKVREKLKAYIEKNKGRNIPKNILIEEYIEMLADDRISEISTAPVTFNINGQEIPIKNFWGNNNTKIKENLKEEKYKDQKYNIVRKKIEEYEEKNKGRNIPKNILMEEYIEMLADDRIQEIVSKAPVTFNINGQEITITQFWGNNNTKITKRLEEEKYKDQKYNIVRKKIEEYEEKNKGRNIPKNILIEEYIEMLADDRISKISSTAPVTFNINGEEMPITYFWSHNNTEITKKLEEEKYKDQKYNLVREKIKNYIEKNKGLNTGIPIDKKIEEYIEMLADDRIPEISTAPVTFNINGQEITIKMFWRNNNTEITKKLKEEKYKDPKYDIVREKIKTYIEKNKGRNAGIPKDILIEEYIEMLADDRISEILSSAPVTFNIDGQEIPIKQFWGYNNTEITKRLEEEKYKDPKYNIVREKIEAYIEKNKGRNIPKDILIEEYIEMLADDRIPEISIAPVTFNINGQEITMREFWHSHNTEITKKLEEKYKDPKYNKVREKLKAYIEKNKGRNIPKDILIEEYIEMLADDRIPEIKSKVPITFNIGGQEIPMAEFWYSHNTEITKRLEEEKYKDQKYNKVREKIEAYIEKNKGRNIPKDILIEEYIEMLANDRIQEIKSKAPVTFNINGQEITITQFWGHNNTEITKRLEEEKYKDPKYDIAKLKVERASNLKQNKEQIEELCNEFGINYKKNKKYLDKMPYKLMEIILTYLKEEGKMYDVGDIWMSSKDFKEKHGKSFEELLEDQKRK